LGSFNPAASNLGLRVPRAKANICSPGAAGEVPPSNPPTHCPSMEQWGRRSVRPLLPVPTATDCPLGFRGDRESIDRTVVASASVACAPQGRAGLAVDQGGVGVGARTGEGDAVAQC